jgi:hypothetical protein
MKKMKIEISNIKGVDKIISEILEKEKIDYKKIDNIEIDGIDTKDYPDFCDAYISSADYDGKPMTDEQLDELNEDGDYVYGHIMDYLQ